MLQWSRRLASCYVGPFPSAPPRTGRAPFGAPGSPVSARRRCLVRPLEWDDVPSPTAWKVRATTTLPPYRGGPAVRRCVGGYTLASLEAEVRTIRSSPYRAGLAGRDRQRLRTAPASTACYGPL